MTAQAIKIESSGKGLAPFITRAKVQEFEAAMAVRIARRGRGNCWPP